MPLIQYPRRAGERHKGKRRTCGDGGGDQSAAPISQGKPKTANKHQKLEEARKDSPLQVSGGAQPRQHLNCRFLASRIVRK